MTRRRAAGRGGRAADRDGRTPSRRRPAPSSGVEPLLEVSVVTLFPGMFEAPLGTSIVGRARKKGVLSLSFVDPRKFATDRYRTVDDRPYGGGPGMVLMAEPLYRAVREARRFGGRAARPGAIVIHLSPQGERFDQALARELAAARRLVLVCGHYEGIDERVLEFADREVSIGDYVLTGGELPAMVVIDAVTRLLPGVLTEGAAARESFSKGSGFDHPHYTRPREWRGRPVPEALLTGDHARIEAWRVQAAEEARRRKRPDLL